jgi:hypothetical protein
LNTYGSKGQYREVAAMLGHRADLSLVRLRALRVGVLMIS